MWAIRFLSGPQAGQVHPLKPGKNRLGRGPSCEVRIASGGVSKEHAQIFVTEDKLIVTDLGSSNGTFVNGVRIQNHKVNPGDKLAFHDVLADIIVARPSPVATFHRPPPAGFPQQGLPPQHAHWGGNAAPQMHPQMHQMGHPSQMMNQAPHEAQDAARRGRPAPTSIFQKLTDYFENVAMPGVYQIAQMFEYRWVIGGMVFIYILLVTTVAVIPTVAMIKSSVQEESQRRATTIARNLAATNRQAIVEKNEVAVSTRSAEIEDGVASAMIISAKDGSVIAPANQRGSYGDKAFVVRVRKSDKPLIIQIDGSTVGASEPIVAYNSDQGSAGPVAYAVIFYDISSIAMKDGRILGLFLQILGISSVLGFLLFVFMIRVIEHPLAQLNFQLDDALREGRDELKTTYQFPRLANLAANISSALARIGSGGGQALANINRDSEAINLIGLLGGAGLAVNAIDDRIIVTNGAFDTLVGGGVDLRGRSINEIPDSSLQLQLRDLIPRLRSVPEQIATATMPFLGEMHEIRAQAIVTNDGTAAYYIVSIGKTDMEGE